MNIPASIKGFNIPAPSFPYIEGLPLYPFAAALFAALQERATYVGRSISWSYPYPATGRGFCPVQSHTHEHFLILNEFDDELNGICSRYINQYTINQSSPSEWTFNTLLAKALELLGLEVQDGIERLGSNNYGRTIAPWGIQRAVMLSLLKMTDRSSHLSKIHADDRKSGLDFTSFEDLYNQIAADINWVQSSNGQEIIERVYLSQDTVGYYYGTIQRDKQTKLYVPEGYEYLRTCPLTMIVNVTPEDTFYDFGTGFVSGLNTINTSCDENDIIWHLDTILPPPSFQKTTYGFTSMVNVYADLYGHFTYGMTWDET